jgi:hypothetical protein
MAPNPKSGDRLTRLLCGLTECDNLGGFGKGAIVKTRIWLAIVSAAILAQSALGQLVWTDHPGGRLTVSGGSGGSPVSDCNEDEPVDGFPVEGLTHLCAWEGNDDSPGFSAFGAFSEEFSPTFVGLVGSISASAGPVNLPLLNSSTASAYSGDSLILTATAPVLVRFSYSVNSTAGDDHYPHVVVDFSRLYHQATYLHLEFVGPYTAANPDPVYQRLDPSESYKITRLVEGVVGSQLFGTATATGGVQITLQVVPEHCSADFNNDGDIGTDADIESYFACLAGGCCPNCGSADFNGDGDIGTDADIESFFRVLAGGSC